MAQKIEFPEIPNKILGVDEPFLLNAKSDHGIKIVYVIVSGSEFAEIVDDKQVNILAPGTVNIRATAPAFEEIAEVTLERSFDISNGTYFERLESISQIRRKLDNDKEDLLNIAKTPIGDIESLNFTILPNAVDVTINGKTFSIDYKRMALKFIESATDFWTDEITAEEIRLASLVEELKTINP